MAVDDGFVHGMVMVVWVDLLPGGVSPFRTFWLKLSAGRGERLSSVLADDGGGVEVGIETPRTRGVKGTPDVSGRNRPCREHSRGDE